MTKSIILGTLFLFTFCLLFAYITDHRWEDWYITYRAAKNLAIGNGLVFNIGEHVMTYTSPLGTLIPAAIKYLFSQFTDDFIIWVYRCICAMTLASTSIFIVRIGQYLKYGDIFSYLTILLFGSNFLIIDNTINGMESAFMVFFEIWLIYLLITKPVSDSWKLAFCFVGIMYTRPDGFIYAGNIIFGFILFRVNGDMALTKQNIFNILRSILLAMMLFAPWIIITSIYYGTPIPHTIIAKSKSYTISYLLESIINYTLTFKGSPNLFLPSYAVNFGGWGIFKPIAQVISIITMFIWMLPKVNKIARALSFSSLLMVLYLNIISGQGPSPWYLPSVITPSLFVIGLLVSDLFRKYIQESGNIKLRIISSISVVFLFAFILSSFYHGVRMIKYQQKIVEIGNRKQIGLWLNSNAKPHDRVFMECLGYIGFYSNLKTYDFPGMSSPEVVKARKELKSDKYAEIINYLKPEWLVLRAGEATEIKKELPNLMLKEYTLAKTFDVRSDIARAKIKYGEPFLYVDALFEVYHKN